MGAVPDGASGNRDEEDLAEQVVQRTGHDRAQAERGEQHALDRASLHEHELEHQFHSLVFVSQIKVYRLSSPKRVNQNVIYPVPSAFAEL